MRPPASLEQCTALIKTLLRPKALERLLASIRQYYPTLDIIVLDDSPDAHAIENPAFAACLANLASHMPAEHNIGLSEGRNRLLAACDTPYFVLLDDDFVFTDETRLESLFAALNRSDQRFDLVGMRLNTNGKDSYFEGRMRREGTVLHCEGLSEEERTTEHAVPVDICYNCFAAHTDTIKAVGWDPRLKFCEHISFFLRLQAAGVRCGYHQGVSIGHRPDDVSTPQYQDYRRKRDDMWALYQTIHGIERHQGGLSRVR